MDLLRIDNMDFKPEKTIDLREMYKEFQAIPHGFFMNLRSCFRQIYRTDIHWTINLPSLNSKRASL